MSNKSAANHCLNHLQDDDVQIKPVLTPTCGIRATGTTLPCQHCNDKESRRPLKMHRTKLCYYCHRPGHFIYDCKSKENDENTQLISQAVNAGIRKQRVSVEERNEMIVTGSEGGTWGDIWYVSLSFTQHYAGNLNVFKRIKHLVGVETNSGENDFLFMRGIGIVEVKSNNEKLLIQGVLYTPELDRNVLSLNQLTMQGFTVKKDGDTCKIFPMFSSPIDNTVNEITGLTKEDELGLKEKQKVIRLNDVNEKYKEEYLNSYFEDLHVSSDETDWSVMIIRALEFNDFKDCVNLLNMLEDSKFVFHYKYELEKKFDEMVSWFLISFLGITTRPMPPVMTENRKVDLLSLYMIVERDGGYNSVTEDNLWPIIAKDMGFEYKDGEYMRTVYAMYLDILVYYYKFKAVQTKANDSERMKDKQDAPECSLERSTSAEEVKNVTEVESFALYAENSWEGAWNAHKKRRKFNFDHARKAVEEANASVLKGDRESTSTPLGFRISGLQVYTGEESGFYKPERDYMRKTGLDDVKLILRNFVSSNPSSETGQGPGPDCSLVSYVYGGPNGILAQLVELKKWFEDQTMYHFHACSLLFMFDQRLTSEGGRSNAVVKLIDFAHVTDGNGVIDHNFLGGLCSLIKFISDIVAEANDHTATNGEVEV
ncbi:putative inositol-polyphosphate multikinase [Helianthus annuus]|nr:putative inositol-polyphosphate multikinase [Helianthus annuus]KAJ0833859.1 putative inositol-polyphosphate multikinase [Helianthus annuus]